MFIQTESTPNPQTLKFLPGEAVMPAGETAFFTDAAQAAKESPLAATLFDVKGVNAIFLGSDFITVTKQESVDWSQMKTMLLTAIMDHYVAGKPIIKRKETDGAAASSANDSELVTQIKELIETRVRPAVAQDGGDIIFHSFEEDTGTVRLELHGSCSGCPSSTMTLKQGIENMLKHYVPEVQVVEAVPSMAA